MGDFFKKYQNKIFLDDTTKYIQISVRNTGKVEYRTTNYGKDIGRKRQYLVDTKNYPDTLTFTRQTIYEGGIGYIPSSLNGAIVTENMPLLAKNSKIDKNFSKILFKTHLYYHNVIEKNKPIGSAQKALHEKVWLESVVTVPTLLEQQKIGEFFKQLDSLITLHQRKLDHLEEQKKGFLQKMFPKKGQTVPEIRFPGFTDAWEQRRLGEVGKTQSGIGFPNKEQGGHQGIPFFKVSDMNNEGNEFEMKISNNYVTEIQIANRKWKPISEVPAVIFAKVGAALMLNRKRLVKVPFLIDNNTMAYIFSNEWDPYFGKTLFDTLNLPRYAQIGALPSFNGSDIENIKVMLPSLREQQALSHFFQNINSLITLHQRKLNHLKLLKKSLLQQMFI
ncbi:restriction endonuclease subunit S [Limosilactobacillus oris]|uniref:restriction endonuclease subunit S n=1 Tax=Limosilactobacillus oris TaxID=1632 RepID=UPI0021B3989B|nr:restriction endonuclease subunit S [Limosilactobacillus oris]UXC67617.1 restriction endonuclease subunit S [Limosilactobacillus oris]